MTDMRYECCVCGYTNSEKDGVVLHLDSHELESKMNELSLTLSDEFCCKVCDYESNSRVTMLKHLSEHSLDERVQSLISKVPAEDTHYGSR